MNRSKRCGEDFWNYTENEGKKSIYTGSKVHFHARPDIPHYYDETKFKRAQGFFLENLGGTLTATAYGLLAIFSKPEDIPLIAADVNLEPIVGYKSFKEVILHLYSWYQGDLKSGSGLWKSIDKIRKLHDADIDKGIRLIDQAALATTQFGFVGFILIRPEKFGLQPTRQDLKAIVHFWRVIGYMIGMEDSFNICKVSLEETTSICKAKIRRVNQSLLTKHKQSANLQFCVLDGLYPTFHCEPEVVLNSMYNIIEPRSRSTEKHYYKTSKSQEVFIGVFMNLCRYKLTKNVMNAYFKYIIYIWEYHSKLIEDELNGIKPLTII